MMPGPLQRRLDQRVSVYAFTGTNAFGDTQYTSSPTSYPARIETANHETVDLQGRDVVATQTVFLGPSSSGDPVFRVQDKLVLPDGNTPSIHNVEVLRGRVGHHHIAIHCG